MQKRGERNQFKIENEKGKVEIDSNTQIKPVGKSLSMFREWCSHTGATTILFAVFGKDPYLLAVSSPLYFWGTVR